MMYLVFILAESVHFANPTNQTKNAMIHLETDLNLLVIIIFTLDLLNQILGFLTLVSNCSLFKVLKFLNVLIKCLGVEKENFKKWIERSQDNMIKNLNQF